MAGRSPRPLADAARRLEAFGDAVIAIVAEQL
jgi:hypothetical protein